MPVFGRDPAATCGKTTRPLQAVRAGPGGGLRKALYILGLLAVALAVGRSRADASDAAVITLSTTPVAPISPFIYGINYDWNKVPAERFPAWNRALQSVAHYTLVQYPGGWNPEHYDWATNAEPSWRNVSRNGFGDIMGRPGIDPDTLLASVPAADFVTPSLPAIQDPGRIPEIVATAQTLVRKYGDKVRIWDIGNEWWLQRGAKRRPRIRAENLRRYAALVAAIVPAMKAVDPAIAIYAGADWRDPQQFAALRELVGASAWAMLDGVSVHTYCNDLDPPCSSIPSAAATIRSLAAKDRIFDSQWFFTRRGMADDYGIKNANHLVLAIRDLAWARMEGAIIWPVTDFIPELNFVSADYAQPFASGVLFGWMAQYYEGQALPTGGAIPAAAARSAQGVSVFVPSNGPGLRQVRIALAQTGLSHVASAQVLYAEDPEDPDRSRLPQIASLPISIRQTEDGPEVAFTLNPGTAGRGSGWEIARVTLQ